MATISKQQHLSILYQQHQPWLHLWLKRKLGNSDHAADIAHDTWLKLFKQDLLPETDQSRPYLVQIAKGLMVDRFRRSRVEQAYLQTLQEYAMHDTICIEQQYLILETLLQLDQALSKLPENVKQAFLMHRIEGRKYKEIAELLDISLSSVEKYIARALLTCLMVLQDEC